MSAFVVDEIHIALLVRAIIEGPSGYHGGPGNAWSLPNYLHHDGIGNDPTVTLGTELGRILLGENIRSVSYRYPNDAVTDLPGPIPTPQVASYTYERPRYRLTAVEILAAIACYEYQTCETPDHAETVAWKLCQRLAHSTVRCLPGYGAAPWEWTAEEIARRAA